MTSISPCGSNGRRARRHRDFRQGLCGSRQAPHRHARRGRPASLQEYRRARGCLELGHAGTRIPASATAREGFLPGQYRTAILGVLPFDNLSGGADEYFSDGLTEDLIHALSLQSFYRVLGRNSTFPSKARTLHAPDRARNRRHLSDPGFGPARRPKIRVTADLIAPEKGEQLWTGRYDRDMGDLFALQDEITTSLSAAIAPEIYPRGSIVAGATRHPT